MWYNSIGFYAQDCTLRGTVLSLWNLGTDVEPFINFLIHNSMENKGY